MLAVLAVICGYTSASCRLFSAETLDSGDAEPSRNSGNAGCCWLLFAILLRICLRLPEQEIIKLMPEKQP
jgi:hypothetical protein